jgi:fibronectin type 3 domain-containing protein
MENRKGARPISPRLPAPFRTIFYFLFSNFLYCTGCGAPGDPVPPTPPVPAAIADLTAQQDGDGMQLSFTLPTSSIAGEKLPAPPAVEILRGDLKPNGLPDSKSFRVVYTIPGALVDEYRFAGHMRFTDPIAPGETKAHPGGTVAYIVRTRASQKRTSADSNVVSIRVFSVPERIASVEARVTESAIELSWPVPAHTSSGDPLPAVTGYRIYRSEISASAGTSSTQVLSQGKGEAHSSPLATSETNRYRDTSFTFDQTYVYIVRSYFQVEGKELESSDSQPLTVTPRDTFPPAAPQVVVAVPPHCSAADALYVELSWSIGVETDLAGYNVYRSEQEDTRGQLLTPALLVPTYRDASVQSGRKYWYTVTAVDRAGNESSSGPPAMVFVQAEACTL